ncbi:MAG: DegV family protein [Lachnospiraceae bacterium]
MNDFAIIGDVASGLHRELRERFGIDDYIVGKVVFPDGTDHVADLDWEEISPDEYYSSMKTGKAIYKTGIVSLQAATDVIEKYLQQGRDALVITLSSGMSGSHNVYLSAKKELEAKYPDRKVCIVDSLRFSTPIVMMNMKASEMRSAGCTIEETAAWLEKNRNRFRQMGLMNDLKFLARTGRVTNFKAFFGTLVGVNALGDFSPAGISQVLGNVKGITKALSATIEYVKRTIENPEEQIIFIGHTYRINEARKLKAMVEEQLSPKEVIITRVDMSSGANIGPGMVGVYYFGKEATEGLAEETKIMEETIAAQK